MLSLKKSPRKSEFFRSRLMARGEDAATIRDVRRLREFLGGQIVMSVLQAGFLVALVLFARAVYNIFERHGGTVNPVYLRLSLGGILLCFFLVVRRLVQRLRDIFELRRDLNEANRKLRALRERLHQQDEH